MRPTNGRFATAARLSFIAFACLFALQPVCTFQTTHHHGQTSQRFAFHKPRKIWMTSNPLKLDEVVLIEHGSSGMKKTVKWDGKSGSFHALDQRKEGSKRKHLVNFLKNCFFPAGAISTDYYVYSLWRLVQRFITATSSVFGTQALLLALGFKSNKIGLAAATTWVLKDALGKISRIFWASKHGRKFDSDAKKWRFRSSIIFATGNGLEILTYIVPSLFLLTAALANALKQMAMLTSSATRNTIYRSFARNSDNIGDITAKGEAQIAVIDLLGMGTGVLISRAIGTSRQKISAAFVLLSVIDLFCIFNEIKSVVFTTLNFERSGIVLRHLFSATDGKALRELVAPAVEEEDGVSDEINVKEAVSPSESLSTTVLGEALGPRARASALLRRAQNAISALQKKKRSSSPETAAEEVTRTESVERDAGEHLASFFERPVATKQKRNSSIALTPLEAARREPILLPTRFGEDIFRSWSCVEASPEVLKGAIEAVWSRGGRASEGQAEVKRQMDPGSKYLVTLNARIASSWMEAKLIQVGVKTGSILRSVKGVPIVLSPQVLLHKNATEDDIFNAILTVHRIIESFSKESVAVSADAVGEALRKMELAAGKRGGEDEDGDREKDSRSFSGVDMGGPSEAIITALGLDSTGLLARIEQARTYQEDNRDLILDMLRDSGWDVNKFTFGNVRTRVEW